MFWNGQISWINNCGKFLDVGRALRFHSIHEIEWIRKKKTKCEKRRVENQIDTGMYAMHNNCNSITNAIYNYIIYMYVWAMSTWAHHGILILINFTTIFNNNLNDSITAMAIAICKVWQRISCNGTTFQLIFFFNSYIAVAAAAVVADVSLSDDNSMFTVSSLLSHILTLRITGFIVHTRMIFTTEII